MGAEPASALALLAAAPTIVYVPGATAGDVTRNVVETVPPGAAVRLVAAKAFCHPLGAVAWSAKLEDAHPALSVLVTAMLYVTGVPDGTVSLRPGDATMRGAERTQVDPIATLIVALVLVTEATVMVTPETGSVNVLPTSRKASSVNEVVWGVMSSK
jgi:hypothetical protein